MHDMRFNPKPHQVRLLIHALTALQQYIGKSLSYEREPPLAACLAFTDEECAALQAKLQALLKGNPDG